MKKDIAEKIIRENDMFYKIDVECDGEKFSLFDYNFATYEDFEKNNAFEIRCILFSDKLDHPVWSIHKFFNINESNQVSLQRMKKIVREPIIRDKIDGSLITCFFIGEKMFVKSRKSFKSEHAMIARNIIESKYKKFVKELWDEGIQVFFELISWRKQIVIYYDTEDLVPIQMRYRQSGKYVSREDFYNILNSYNIEPFVRDRRCNWDELLEMQKNKKGIEGWVVFDNNNKPILKVKTYDYLERHRIIGNNELNYKMLLQLFFNNELDDVISSFSENSLKRQEIEGLRNNANKKINRIMKELQLILLKEKELDAKNFALKYKDHEYFYILMKTFRSSNALNLKKYIKEYFLKKYNSHKKAEKFFKG